MKILSIGAHQDDNEFRVGGMACKWIKAGHEVRFLSVCDGCGGHHILTPEETTAQRATESFAVAEYLGITYDVWDIHDCELTADLETRKRLIRYIRFCPRSDRFSPHLRLSRRPPCRGTARAGRVLPFDRTSHLPRVARDVGNARDHL